MPDIRNMERIGSDGAETLFCDTFTCKKDQNVLLGIAGLKTYEDRIDGIISKQVDDYFRTLDYIETLKKELIEKKSDIEALIAELGCDELKWGKKHLVVFKNEHMKKYPKKDLI